MYHTDVILKSKHVFHIFWGVAEMCALQIIKIPSIYLTKMQLVKEFCLKFYIFGPRRFGCSKFTKYHVSVILQIIQMLQVSQSFDTLFPSHFSYISVGRVVSSEFSFTKHNKDTFLNSLHKLSRQTTFFHTQ